MADDELAAFLKEQIDKRNAKAAKKREAELAADIRRQASRLAELERVKAILPRKIEKFAMLSTVPLQIVIDIPGCRLITITAEGGGIFKAAVKKVGVFPLADAEDLADAIAAAVIEA